MTGEHLAGSDNHDHVHDNDHYLDPKRRTSRLDSNALIQGLERLRDCVEQRLNRLEAAARERAAQPAPVLGASELEQKLQRRIAEYDEAQLRLRAQAERHEQEWRTALEQIEGDRKLLADAWERLEREQIETTGAAAANGAGRPHTDERIPAATARTRQRQAVDDAPSDSVTEDILKQFHALRNDVRRNARQRGSH
jgi:hypothetical protein